MKSPHSGDAHTADQHTADQHTADQHTADQHTADVHSLNPLVSQAVAEGQRRVYEDPAALNRVWDRLARTQSRARVSRQRPVLTTLSAAALLCAGVLLGISVERTTGEAQRFTVHSERLTPQIQSGALGPEPQALPVTNGSRGVSSRLDARGTPHEPSRAVRVGRKPAALSPASEVGQVALVAPLEVNTPSPAAIKPGWLNLAERGDFTGAYQQLQASGGFDQTLLAAGPDELMTLVDVARAVGQQGQAILALRIVLDQYRDDENAPLAAMMLGNLLSRTGDAAGAAEAFALNRRLSPGGDFAEDALVREFDMAVSANDLAEAERLRAQYEREYPEGKHQDALRADCERLAQELVPVEGDSSDNEEEESAVEGTEDSGTAEEETVEAPVSSTPAPVAADP